MKKILVLAVISLASAVMAETASIENVIVRQRWPWSKVVDIDFTVRGNATGVKFVAKYDGAEQFVLAEKDLTGDFCDVLEPGLHHVTWDPAKAGLSETELKNFTISVEPDDALSAKPSKRLKITMPGPSSSPAASPATLNSAA